jgi:hypothetical protein
MQDFDETIKIEYNDVNKNLLVRFFTENDKMNYTFVIENDLENESTGLFQNLEGFENLESTSEKVLYLVNKLKEDKII